MTKVKKLKPFHTLMIGALNLCQNRREELAGYKILDEDNVAFVTTNSNIFILSIIKASFSVKLEKDKWNPGITGFKFITINDGNT
jgi:hypothetical protein